MNFRTLFLLGLIFCLISPSSFALQFNGGKGLIYTSAAQTNAPGLLSFDLYTRSYSKPLAGRDIRNNVMAISGNFGFTQHTELGVTQIVYQDINYNLQSTSDNYQLMGYTQLHFKLANYRINLGNKYLFFGTMLNVTKQGKLYNIYLEPYYDVGIAGELDFLFSYYWNPFYPEESPALHLNFGYINFNDHQEIFQSGQAIPVSLGFVKSSLRYDYGAEIHGRLFVNPPYAEAYSQENYLYFSPSYRYKIFLGLSIGLYADILLFSQDEKTDNQYVEDLPSIPQYSEWRIGFKFNYIPSTGFYKIPTFEKVSKETVTKESLRARRVITDKKALFEWIVDENKGAEYIDLELEKIREERKRAEEELEKLKKELSEKSK